MKLNLLFPIVLQVLGTAHCLRDFPANYTAYASAGKMKYNKDCNCSAYGNSLTNVLARKKRAFVFFPGSVVVLTDVAAKHLLSVYPRGMIQSNELDVFYDVPLYVEGWRQPVDNFIKSMRAQIKSDKVAPEDDEKLKNVGVVNASAIPLDEYYKKSYYRPTWSRYPTSYKADRKNVWNSNRRNFQTDPRRPYNRGSSRRYYPNSQRRNYAQSMSSSQNRNKAANRSYPRPGVEYNRSYRNEAHTPNTGKQNNNETPLWHHHREYRERRDIYAHLETFGKAVGVKLRKCILRAICEMKQEMLPQGESFINDMARILFTVPTDHDNKEDEFTQMALEENVDCARRFLISCPHSPLDYFLTNFRPTGVDKSSEPTANDIMNSIVSA